MSALHSFLFSISLKNYFVGKDDNPRSHLKAVPTVAEGYNFSSIVFNKWLNLVGKIYKHKKTKPLAAPLILFILCIAITLLISLIAKQPYLPNLIHIIYFLGTGIFGLYIVWRCYYLLVPTVAKCAADLPYSEEGCKQLLEWFCSSFDMRRQFKAIFVTIAIYLLVWILLDLYIPSFPTNLSLATLQQF
jgi:hypothetical protein